MKLNIKEISSLMVKEGDIVFDINPKFHGLDAAGFEVKKIDSINNALLMEPTSSIGYKRYLGDPRFKGNIGFSVDNEISWFVVDLTL